MHIKLSVKFNLKNKDGQEEPTRREIQKARDTLICTEFLTR